MSEFLDEPGDFLLAYSDRQRWARGVAASYRTVPDAVAARPAMVVGALAFDGPAALTVPTHYGDDRPDLPLTPLPAITITAERPSPTEHAERVAQLVSRIDGTPELEKVVLARAVDIAADAPILPSRLAAAMRERGHNVFSVDLSAAGEPWRGRHIVGSSPELLVSKRGTAVSCRPFAGTYPRAADDAADAAIGEALRSSTKNRREHDFVVQWLRERLALVCTDVTVAAEPALHRTSEVWHLATDITATAPAALSALELANHLHPTPAVAGTPTADAMRLISDIESDRGFYGGAVGWADDQGNGDWVVAIRCAQLSADGLTATAHAGGGIVAGSDPQEELTETTAKLGTLLRAFAPIAR